MAVISTSIFSLALSKGQGKAFFGLRAAWAAHEAAHMAVDIENGPIIKIIIFKYLFISAYCQPYPSPAALAEKYRHMKISNF
jgi:hypothetical protein